MTFFRPTWAEVDVSAFQKNLKTLAARLKTGARMMVVLKADGYGHGAGPLARAAEKVKGLPLWGFGVSSVEEGIALRRHAPRRPILVLGSLYPFDAFRAALAHGLTPTLASPVAARALARVAARRRSPVPVHVKVDTGMSRIGMSPATVDALFEVLEENKKALRLEGVYTHLARAEDAAATRAALALFDKAVALARRRRPDVMAHAANSAGLLLRPESHYQLVRPGLALYGATPTGAEGAAALEPVLSWKTRVVFLKDVPADTSVSYGGTFRTARRSRLATLPVGYADGYRRALSNKGEVLLRGRRCPVAGRVTMDQIVVDVTDAPGTAVGDEAVLLGAQDGERVTVEDMAARADAISYEIFCGVTGRVPRLRRGAP